MKKLKALWQALTHWTVIHLWREKESAIRMNYGILVPLKAKLFAHLPSIKYILNHRSGTVNYMVRATVSEDRDRVEQVIVARQ